MGIREIGGAQTSRWLRQVLPDPDYAPGYLNEFGGHFVITPEMRAHAKTFRDRVKSRREWSGLLRAVLPDASGLVRRAVSRPSGAPPMPESSSH